MSPPLPRTVHVGPMTYTVTTDKTDLLKATVDQRSPLFGWSCERTQVIGLDPNQADGSKRDTLLHECLHQINVLTGLVVDWDREEEEKIVRRLTPALLDLLRRNPKLVAYLTAP